MIKKFFTIKNLAVFKDFEWDKSITYSDGRPVLFEKLNILYGRNYSGKTSLSRILRAIETGEISDKYDSPNFQVLFDDETIIDQNQLTCCSKKIRVFNEDFVRENLRFINNPDDNIEPFAILGSNNAILEKAIADLESEVGINQEGNETGLYAQLKSEKQVYNEAKSTYKQMASSFDSQLAKKATGRTTGIKYKLDKFGEPNYNKTKLERDIEIVLSKEYVAISEKEKIEHEQLLNEQIKPEINPLAILSLQWEKICDIADELLSREIGESDKINELLRDVSLNEWVKVGCNLHKNSRTTCAFCGGTLTDDRWSVLFKHFDEESRKLEDEINNLLKLIETEKDTTKNGFDVDKNKFYQKYQDQVEDLIQYYSAAVNNYNVQLKMISEQLFNRKQAITITLKFIHSVDYSFEINKIRSNYEEVRVQSNELSNKLNAEQTQAQKTLRLQEVYDFCATIGYDSILKSIQEFENQKERVKEKVDSTQALTLTKEAEIQEKKRQLNDEEKGALLVNKYLTDFFGHEFLSMQATEDTSGEDKKIRFEIMRDGKRAYHLSEGECSLIAFCYFMAKLDDIETKDSRPIIWIDDPISSLDGNHIFFIYSLIAAEIAERGNFEQLFISTHNLDFLKYLRRLTNYEQQPNGKLKSCGKQYFMISRQGNFSSIFLMPKYLKEFGTEFNYLFSCIYKCSLINTVDDTNFELFYNFGNNARKFLEIYLYFKYPDFSEDKLKRFFGEEKVPPILMDRINNEYSHLNGSIERATMPVEVPEMVATAKLIIEKIKEDSDQYYSLLKSIGVTV